MKKFLAIILALAMVLGLAACGGDAEQSTEPSAAASTTPTETPTSTPSTLPVEDPTDEPIDEPTDEPASEDPADYIGVYEATDGFIEVCEDGTYVVYGPDENGEEQVWDVGDYYIEDGGITFMPPGGPGSFFVLDEDGNLYGGEDEGTLVRAYSSGGVMKEVNPEDFFGFWSYPDGTVIEIDNVGWSLYEGEVGDYSVGEGGYIEYEDGYAYLMNMDGSSGGGALYFKDGELFDGDQYLQYSPENPLDGGGDNENISSAYAAVAGEWYYSDQGQWLTLYNDGTFYWDFGEYHEEGTYFFDGEWLTIYSEDGDGYTEARWDEGENRIYVSGDAGSWYYPASEF